jgi:sRNA-binding regulator protein Hfq
MEKCFDFFKMDKKNVQKKFLKTVLLRKNSVTILKIYGVKLNDYFIFYYDIFSKKNLKIFSLVTLWRL